MDFENFTEPFTQVSELSWEELGAPMAEEEEKNHFTDGTLSKAYYLERFQLFETLSNFYLVGRDETKSYWRVLKIARTEPSELNVVEDPITYTERECAEFLRRLEEGNKYNGGLKLRTSCFGIIGFIKFLGPYYMLLITKRVEIGTICGHSVYTITGSEMIQIPNSSVLSNASLSDDENRYKKLLQVVDLKKDLFFSYSYNVMSSLQKNLCDNKAEQFPNETLFIWNEYLTREIHIKLGSTLWTVALVYGFFKQVNLSVSGQHFRVTLIARRSRYFAGTRYLKRGVNERGRVANDVETEQIVMEVVPKGYPIRISSVVQHRGSIPLFWSQDCSPFNLRPDIILSKKDPNYEATLLHFENLSRRYGKPIVILDLIKTNEVKPRESILHAEFSKAVSFLNKGWSKENAIRFLHLDLNKCLRNSGAKHALSVLCKLAKQALDLTGLFYHQVMADLHPGEEIDNGNCTLPEIPSRIGNESISQTQERNSSDDAGENPRIEPMMLQNGVLRTNCIDCIDRTNVAQYAYGLVALGRQLHSIGLPEYPEIGLDDPLAMDLMGLYETMGDTLAMQYGGSAAHNKIFCERRGQWKPATQSQELLRIVQRYLSNTYKDPEKQDAINLFLGYFLPQPGKPAIWELHSDQNHSAGMRSSSYDYQNTISFAKRSLSDGNIISQTGALQGISNIVQNPLPDISAHEPHISYCRCIPSVSCNQLLEDFTDESEVGLRCYRVNGNDHDSSHFLDLGWFSSSENSSEAAAYNRAQRVGLDIPAPPESTVKGDELTRTEADDESVIFSEKFASWVAEGGTLFR
ncbi:hypothetical protein SAY87_018259 [Trapa incisa]|uniref:SAC domain-containing protein n=1 Tax=Trapa incisa TaxID=236973 RepID=A0AAN7LBU2_9MYRT|nr:hypothetical protein SAY87_018259 [Trapa incisa]